MTLYVDLTEQMIAGGLADDDFKFIFGVPPSEVRELIPTIPEGLVVAVERIGSGYIVAVAHPMGLMPAIGDPVMLPEKKSKGVGRADTLGEAMKMALQDYAK